MAFQWQLLVTNAAPPNGSEQWTTIALPARQGLVRYGYRPVLRQAVPIAWNTCGYFTLSQLSAGRVVVGRTNIMPLVPEAGGFCIRPLGPGDFDAVAEGSQALSLLYYPHRWIPMESMQIWGLIDV